MFFGYIFVDILSPLKDLLQTQRGWDSVAFGHYAGSEPFLNVFVFFLIFAGIILDKMGVRPQLVRRDRLFRDERSEEFHGRHPQPAQFLVERHALV